MKCLHWHHFHLHLMSSISSLLSFLHTIRHSAFKFSAVFIPPLMLMLPPDDTPIYLQSQPHLLLMYLHLLIATTKNPVSHCGWFRSETFEADTTCCAAYLCRNGSPIGWLHLPLSQTRQKGSPQFSNLEGGWIRFSVHHSQKTKRRFPLSLKRASGFIYNIFASLRIAPLHFDR